jgi:hypothetical protein
LLNAKNPRNRLFNFDAAHRLVQVIVHARLQATLSIAFHRMCGHGNDRYMRASSLFAFPNLARRRQPIDLRHLHIHKYQAVAGSIQRSHGFAAVPRNSRLVAYLFQHLHRDRLIDGIVFGQQDAQPSQLLPGVVPGHKVAIRNAFSSAQNQKHSRLQF